MTARVLVTERLFWRHWPEVADRFEVKHGRLRTPDGEHCPITAVAESLGGRSVHCAAVAKVLRRRSDDRVPRWADRVIGAADYDSWKDGDHFGAVRRRLLKHVPEATS